MISDEELRARILGVRARFYEMQEQIDGESNLDFADQMIYESEEYLMGEVVKLFNELDAEDVDWGQVNREDLALKLRRTFIEDTGGGMREDKVTEAWLAVADKAIEILLGDGDAVA